MNANYSPKLDIVNPTDSAPIRNCGPRALSNWGNAADESRAGTTLGAFVTSTHDDIALRNHPAREENRHGDDGQPIASGEHEKRDRLSGRVGDYYRWWEFDARPEAANNFI